MDIDSLSSPAPEDLSQRRKSGRATRKPQYFGDDQLLTASKRKRAGQRGDYGDEIDDVDASDVDNGDDDDDAEDDGPDEEEAKVKRRARKPAAKKNTVPKRREKSQSSRAAKKPKTTINGNPKELAIRPATNGKPKSSRTRAKPKSYKSRPIFPATDEGLYGTYNT
jgi:cohesin complex subunit SA-1/2